MFGVVKGKEESSSFSEEKEAKRLCFMGPERLVWPVQKGRNDMGDLASVLKQRVVKAIGLLLTGAGATKKSGSWYFESSETMPVVNLQKSQYSNQHYLNLGFFVSDGVVDSDAVLPEFKADIRVRLSMDTPGVPYESIEDWLDFDLELCEDERVAHLVGLVSEYIVPLIQRCATRRDLLAAYDDGTFATAMVTRSGLERLRCSVVG